MTLRIALTFLAAIPCTMATQPAASDYPSLQQAIDANPGRPVFVPAGDHVITYKLRLIKNNGGLFGPGRIIQSNANQPILEIEKARGITVREVTLTRAKGATDTDKEGILAIECSDLKIDHVRVINNHTRSGAITLRRCRNATVSHCLIRNYMRITIDDRTSSLDWGYAFKATDGTGISVRQSTGTLVEANRVIEERLLPTPELKQNYQLGDFVKRNPKKGNFISQQVWDLRYVANWQQGSGILVTSPEESKLTRILGNHIENGAQGIDLHSDQVIVANNVVANCFMGMKAMHGSRNVLINGNQFHKCSLWAIGLMPGAAAHTGNFDGGSIIANNMITDFGHGDASWIWGTERSPFKFDTGQQDDDPPLADVIVRGNMVHCVGEPRYRFAVILPTGPKGPRGMHFSDNLFHPGTDGIANTKLPE